MTHVSEIVDKLEARDKAVSVQDTDSRRKLVILKAVGLDRAAPEQRELAIAIAKRYDLDLMLKHLVLIDGKPYVTRDALLWIAHRDGNLDGIEVTEPTIRDYQGTDYWYCEAAVYRKDMSRPFKYGGRYPVKGQNAKFGPEMATKVAESMSLRRAFNISAPTQDERWDAEIPNIEPEAPKSLSEKVAEKAAAVDPQSLARAIERRTEIEADAAAVVEPATDAVAAAEAVFEGEVVSESTEGASPLEQALAAMPPEVGVGAGGKEVVRCAVFPPEGNPLGLTEQCAKAEHTTGAHKSREGSWPQ